MTAAGAAGLVRDRGRVWQLTLGGLILLATAAAIPLSIAARQSVLANAVQNLASSLPYAAVGIVVIRKLPRNPVGWLLAAIGTLSIVATDAGSYAVLAHRTGSHLPLGLVAALLDESYRPAAILLPLAILLSLTGTCRLRGGGGCFAAFSPSAQAMRS